MRKPLKLAPGDTLAAISLSWGGPGTFPARSEVGRDAREHDPPENLDRRGTIQPRGFF